MEDKLLLYSIVAFPPAFRSYSNKFYTYCPLQLIVNIDTWHFLFLYGGNIIIVLPAREPLCKTKTLQHQSEAWKERSIVGSSKILSYCVETRQGSVDRKE